MIVNSLKDGWEIIYQRSHANLAAILVAAWRKQDQVPRWTELIIATAQHDDQEMFWSESVHLTDIGAPLDFAEAELNTARMQAQYVIDNAYRQGMWIALMISMHNSFLYEPMRGQDKQLDQFLDAQQDMQKRLRKLLDCPKPDAAAAYSFLSWADRMSLILCRRQLPERERALDVAPDLHGTMVRVMQRADDTLSLDPWVFEEDELKVSVEVRRLDTLKFEREAQFEEAMQNAEIETREWCFRR
jgi:hypothetical protein